MDTKSSTQQLGDYVTQIIHFVGNVVRTVEHVDTKTIKDGQLCKIRTKDWRMFMINKDNVLMVEVLKE